MNKEVPILNSELASYRALIAQIVKDLHDLTVKINHQELSTMVSDLRNRINEPFMFVIVGEVKVGKSSFINALLATGQEIAKVAPQPMTDTIQQILYGQKHETVEINPYFKKIFLPVDILKEIAIVDTPGTNTIVDHHQEITERFIPASDLIVFVFESKNPYRQSAWEFFDYIHNDWRKKIVFVLQQKDLMNVENLAVNIQGVEDHAKEKGINQPKVFAVSAKQEIEGDTANSGFSNIRQYIQNNITGGKAPLLKLQNNITTSENINERIQKGLEDREEQWFADTAFRKDVKETLEQQKVKSSNQVDVFVENLLAGYDRITYEKERELSSGLSFFSLLRRSFASIFKKKSSAKEWLEELANTLEKDLHNELESKLNSSIHDLADSIQQMAKIIDLKIQNSTTILKNNHAIFSDIAERRGNVLKDLQEAFSKFINKAENFTDEELFPDKSALSPNLATGSGLAAIGVILMAVTNGMVFDITGGILTTIGLLFAGVSTTIKRRKILHGFHAELNKGRAKIEKEVTEKLKVYVGLIKARIDKNFKGFDEMLITEGKQVEELKKQHQNIRERLISLKEKTDTILK
ncbi:MAG: GTP-binding protein [Bacteroidetes bacterium]|nr:GTP-binding protein [Bacteroidota bacterium]